MANVWGGQERRSQKRYCCCGPVKVINPASRLELPATISDISLSGCALHLRRAHLLDADILIELHFTTSYFSFRVVGSVRNFVTDELLVRVAFVQLNHRGWSDIVSFIRDQGDEWPVGTKPSSAQLAAA